MKLEDGLSFPNTYQDAPFHDESGHHARVKGGKKAFLWIYESEGNICINTNVDPEWRELWRRQRRL